MVITNRRNSPNFIVIQILLNMDELGNDKEALYKKLNQDDLIRLEQIFKSAKEEKFTIKELENVLESFNVTFTPDQMKSLFMKVN